MRDDDLGGHTLKRHVGKTDAELRIRLDEEPDIAAASTYTDQKTAEEVVAAAMRANQLRIREWENRGDRRPNLALRYPADRVIGRGLRRGQASAEPCYNAIVVLKSKPRSDSYVLTSYPELPR